MPSLTDQDLPYPDRFHLATKFVDQRFGDLEQNPELSNEVKLILYALRQQAELGQCKEPAPYMWNVTARYKHSAWSGLGQMIKPEAMVHYVRQVEKLEPKWVETMRSTLQNPDEINNNNKNDNNNQDKLKCESNNNHQQQYASSSSKRALQLTPPDSPLASQNPDQPGAEDDDSNDDEEFEIQSSTATNSSSRNRHHHERNNNKKSKRTRGQNHDNNGSVSSSSIPDFSSLSDSQILSILSCAERSPNNFKFLLVDESVLKGLVHEIQRLRRTLVMSHALPSFHQVQQLSSDHNQDVVIGGRIDSEDNNNNINDETFSSTVEMNQPKVPHRVSTSSFVKTTPKVEHQYYGEKRGKTSSNNNNKNVATAATQPRNDEKKTQDVAMTQENQEETTKEVETTQEEKPVQKSGWFSWLIG